MSATFTPVITAELRPIVQCRILYADTDRLGIVYHARYFRYLELARIELLSAAGIDYHGLEEMGLALPLSELGVRFVKPALYGDRITIHAAFTKVTRVRAHVQYRVMVEAGDRKGLTEPVEILTAETRHACIDRATGQVSRLPAETAERLLASSRLAAPADRGPTSLP